MIEVDDARYAEVPREMAESGDWITPTLNYLPYVEKPPLYYWLAAASYKAFGVSEAAGRLPLALLAALGLLLTAWMGSFLYDLRSGLWGAVALSSAALYFALAHYITLDMGLTVMLLGVTAMVLRAASRPADARWAAPAAWLFAALAFLAKGLVAVLLPTAWTAALALAVPAWRGGLRRLLSPLGLALFAAVALPWFIVMEELHPGFLRFIFIEQHFERYLTMKYNRYSPWYFFLLVTPAAMLPWTPALLAALTREPRRWLSQPADLALGLWAVVVVGFFSASSSKLAGYILPVAPHLALLAARAAQTPLSPGPRRVATFLGAVLIAAACAAPLIPRLPPQALPWGALAVAALGIGVFGARARAFQARMGTLALGGLLAGACALAGLRDAERLLSSRPAAQAIAAQAGPNDAVWTYGTYLHGLAFYLRRPVDKMILWIGELHYAKRDPAQAARFGDDRDVSGLPLQGKKTFAVLRAFEARHFISLTPPGAIVGMERFGPWELAEVAPGASATDAAGDHRRRRR